MDSKSLYSAQAASIASRIPERPSGRDAAVLAAIGAHLGARRNGAAIAELSVGDGTLSVALDRAFPEAALTFVDISRPHLDALAGLLGGRGDYVEANLDNDFARLADGAFDAVIALDILEHVFDVFGFVAHCRRVLAPGGALFLRVPNVAYAKHRLTLMAGQLPVTASWFGRPGDLAAWRQTYGWDGGHLHYFTLATLRGLLGDAGLRVVEVADPGARFERLRGLAPSLLCGNLFVVARPRGA